MLCRVGRWTAQLAGFHMATQHSGCTKLVSGYTSVIAEQWHHEDSGQDSTVWVQGSTEEWLTRNAYVHMSLTMKRAILRAILLKYCTSPVQRCIPVVMRVMRMCKRIAWLP